MQITSGEYFDWFKPPPAGEEKVYFRMLELSHTPFVNNLINCYDSEFPGESFYALQIMGMWLSWVRIHYAKVKHATHFVKKNACIIVLGVSLILWRFISTF